MEVTGRRGYSPVLESHDPVCRHSAVWSYWQTSGLFSRGVVAHLAFGTWLPVLPLFSTKILAMLMILSQTRSQNSRSPSHNGMFSCSAGFSSEATGVEILSVFLQG